MKSNLLRISLMSLLAMMPLLLSAQWSLVRFDEHNFFTRIETTTPVSSIATGIDNSINGSFIMRTNDAGGTWDSIPVLVAGNTYSISELNFTDVNNGFAGGHQAGFQALLKTADNGSTWNDITPDVSSINPITSISFVDPVNGYSSNETNLYRTIDGGANWTNTVPGFVIEDLRFTDMTDGYACGTLGTNAIVKRTFDSGQTWNTVLTTSFPFFSVSAMQKLDVINSSVVFCSGQYSDKLFRTIDGGFTWDTLSLSMIYGIQDYDFSDANNGHVLSTMGEIYATADGGQTWTLEYAVAGGAYGPSIYLVSVSFTGATGFVCGSNGLIKKHADATTGLVPNSEDKSIMLYPNPISSKGVLTIEGATSDDQLEIFNHAGQLVLQKNNVGEFSAIEINLPAGVYMVSLRSESRNTRQKLVVVN